MKTFKNKEVYNKLMAGGFIPAHPLALNSDLTINKQSHRRLTRYYLACGVDGIAIGVHTTQFEIRDPKYNYYRRVLEITAEELLRSERFNSLIKVAGICGTVNQAIEEAKIAKSFGYDLGLLSMGGLDHLTEDQLLIRTKQVAEIIPVFGFYLQPSVGGRVFSYSFWEKFCNIENVFAIKAAPFDRYHTLDVVRAVCNSERESEIALYTGNDDNILNDLITPYRFKIKGKLVEKRFVGGLLGHYAVWTQKSAELFNKIKEGIEKDSLNFSEVLQTGVEVTDMNSAIFDTINQFKGSISGIHEVLRRQGLLDGVWCLNPKEKLSDGQAEEIQRVIEQYPHLIDDEFVKEFLLMDKEF